MFYTPIHIINRLVRQSLYRLVLLLCAQMFICLQAANACTLVCNNNISVALPANGIAVIPPAMIMEGGSTTCTDLGVEVFDNNGNPIGDSVDCSHVGLTLTAHLIDLNTNNFCASSITILDAIEPILTCPDIFILCNAPAHPDSIGYPTATDNCKTFTNADLSYTENIVDLPCFTTHNGNAVTARIDRTWTAVDDSNNSTTCVQNIYLLRSLLSDVVFPPNRDGFAAPKLTCSIDDPNDLQAAGEPLLGGRPIDNAGLCEILIYFSDQNFPLCGGGSRILREWVAFDICTNNQISEVQIIDTEDAIDPEIICPADIGVSTDPNLCTATVLLPAATATDECSNVTITAAWAFGTGLGPHAGVTVGTHLVTYTATDDCGNSSICNIEVTVEDTSPPTPVCENNLSVSLLPDGTARVNAPVFDEGTNDNCAIDRFEVSRDGLPFAAFVDFTCLDLNNPVTVQFRAFDIYGLSNDCWVEVTVNDNFAPSISCPADLSINCEQDPEDLTLVGEATTSEACSLDTLFYTDQVNVTCGNGTINRTWTAIDGTGNSSTCTQVITVVDNNNFTVNFPPDVTIDLCSNSTNPSNTGSPLLMGESCRNVEVTYSDQVFTSPLYCYSIIRNWVVIDWCDYDPNAGNNNGYYTHGQIIEVFDNSNPTISCPVDMIVQDLSANCAGVLVTVPLANAVDCDPNVTITNDSPYASANGEDASGFYPHGLHTITFTAEDNCGNTASCTMEIEVVDGLAPTVTCLNGVTANIGTGGVVNINPAMVLGNAFDNCTNSNDLIIDVIPSTFTCNETGIQNITVTATDQDGNVGNCMTTITINDPNNLCNGGTVTIGGKVSQENGVEMIDIEMNISGGQTGMIQTDQNGDYDFVNLASGANYTVTPERDNFHANGVTTFDLVVIQQHILGIAPLSSPYKMIAADANNSGSITTFDIIQIRQIILGILVNYPANNSWRFVESSFVFPNPSNPWQTAFPEQTTFNNQMVDEMDTDFVAVKIGDINNSAGANSLTGESMARSANELIHWSVENQSFSEGEDLEVLFKSDDALDDLMSMQCAMQFENESLELIGVSDYHLENLDAHNFGFKQSSKGLIKFSWDQAQGMNVASGEALFSIKFKALRDGELTDVLSINDEVMANEVYDLYFIESSLALNFTVQMNDEEIEVVEEQMEEMGPEISENFVGQNYPNPVRFETRIPLQLKEDALVELNIYDAQGKLLNKKSLAVSQGEQEILLTKEDIKLENGIAIYTIKINDEKTVSKKMILAQ